jgi:hypothetical protein
MVYRPPDSGALNLHGKMDKARKESNLTTCEEEEIVQLTQRKEAEPDSVAGAGSQGVATGSSNSDACGLPSAEPRRKKKGGAGC